MPNVKYRDLREWLKIVEGLGELKVVEGANVEEDIGMATELINHTNGSPAVIFDNIPGYAKGYRVLSNALRTEKRLATTFGQPLGMPRFEQSTQLYKMIQNIKGVPPVYVNDGPIMENVFEGDEVDVLKFPAPKWHELDGGKYIGTASYDITRDPDNGDVNLGTYRVMVSDKNHLFFFVSPGKHGRIHRDKFFARKEPCPIVVVVGGDPLLYMFAANEVPPGVCEYDWAGAVRGEPTEVIKGKYTGLPIPARAELAFEGFAHYDDLAEEGPFGEWTGYYASGARQEPRIEVKAIYHRNNPIILGSPPNCPPDEISFYRAFWRSPLLKEQMEKAGIPGVTATWCHEVGGGGCRLFLAVAIKQRYPGHAAQAGHVASQCHRGAYCGRYVIVVDDDIDVTNLEEVIWAMCTRSDPATSIDIIHRAWSTYLDPRIPPEQREIGALWNSRAIIDATRPYEWIDKFPPVNLPSPEVRKRTLEKWGYLVGKK
jgi:UbiD family decarboxylase